MKKILIIVLMGLCLYNIAFIFLFDKKYEESQTINGEYEILTVKEETTYYNKYECKNKKNDKFLIYSKKEYVPGDIIKITGEFNKGETRRNYKGFDYSNYLKQNKIYGIIKINTEEYVRNKKDIYYMIGKIKIFIINKIEKAYLENEQDFLKGVLLGSTKNIDSETKDLFKKSSISHILAISGLHITYIVSGIKVFISRFIKSKRKQNVILIISLVFFSMLTGGSASCVRACIMNTMILFSELVYRKNNFYISFLIVFIVLIFINPFNIYSIGMWLSFLGTLGIVLFSKMISKIIIKKTHINKSIVDSLSTSISAQILIFPIMIYCFNTISLTFFIPNIIISYIVGPILILGYVSILIPYKLSKFVSILEKILIKLLYKTAQICSNIPFARVYLKTPSIIFVIIYYSAIFVLVYLFQKKKFFCLRRIIRPKKLVKKSLKYVLVILIIISLSNINLDNSLRVYFVDVGQGDCSIVKTPTNKTIIIDGGEDPQGKIVLPYLLDRRIDKIDYMIISHFDSDHVGGLIPVIRELKVKNIIISKQYEESENYNEVLNLAQKKNIKIIVVKKRRENRDRKEFIYGHIVARIKNDRRKSIK